MQVEQSSLSSVNNFVTSSGSGLEMFPCLTTTGVTLPTSSSRSSSSSSSSSSGDSDSDENCHAPPEENPSSEDNATDNVDCVFEGKIKMSNFDRLNKKYRLDEPILPNVVNTSKFECFLMVLNIAMQEGFSQKGIRSVLEMINELFGKEVIPSEHIFSTIFTCDFGMKYHFYCSECDAYIGEYSELKPSGIVKCPIVPCGKERSISGMNGGHFFISFPLAPQFRVYLEKMKNCENLLAYRFNRDQSNGAIRDVFDGLVYRKLADAGGILSNPDNFSCSVTTDGTPVFKSVKKSLWPIQCRINEFPPDQRFDSDNMFVCGLWYGSKEPIMNVFLRPFVLESRSLYDNGFTWQSDTGRVITSKVVILNFCLDSRAKPDVQCFKQLHSYDGCGYCYHPGDLVKLKKNEIVENETVAGCEVEEDSDEQAESSNEEDACNSESEVELIGAASDVNQRRKKKKKKKKRVTKAVRYCFSSGGVRTERTDEEMRNDMQLSQDSSKIQRGVKGISVVTLIPLFDVVFGFAIDFLHAVLLGVVKTLLGFWFDKKFSKKPYSIRSRLKEVDARLLGFCPPQNISRRPRTLSEYVHFKANELRAWLFFYSLPALEGILPDEYFRHYGLLVSAIFILCSDSITMENWRKAKEHLELFVRQFEELYGPAFMVHNVHLLLHLAQMVLLYGPLWNFSMFVFETGNGVLKNLVKGTIGVMSQISNKYMTYRCLPVIVDHFIVSDRVLEYCSNLVPKRRCRVASKFDGIVLLGDPDVLKLSNVESKALEEANLPKRLECHHRMILKGTMYHGLTYPRKGIKSYDSAVKTGEGKFGVILRILVVDEEVYVILKNIEVSPGVYVTNYANAKAEHIKVCDLYPFGSVKVLKATSVIAKCVFLRYGVVSYVCEFPNLFEKD